MASSALRRRTAYRTLSRHKPATHPAIRLFVIFLVGFTMLTSGASAATIFFYGQNLPTLASFKSKFQFQNTVIKDRFGHVLYDMADVSRKGRGRRVVEPLMWPHHTTAWYRQQKQYWLTGAGPNDHGIPVVLQDATIATEDATFYQNPGFDPMSIVRAEYDNLTKGYIVSGASTITQQLVRSYMLNPNQRTLTRKTEEIVLAAEMTQKYPKSQILWYYLNSVPYGNLSIGAEAAARTYFHKHVWKLDLAESAMLAGLPEAPSTYDPVNDLPAALNRMRYVLHLMYIHGDLVDEHGKPDPSLIAKAMQEPFNKKHPWHFTPAVTFKRYPHFVQYAIDQLQTIPQLKGKIYNGLDVQTTLMPALQDEAQTIVSNQISQLGAQNVTDGALVSMDLRPSCYGCILAMVGSADYNNTAISGQINMADSPRQPGSSYKPFNYVYAFQHGLAPSTTVLDGPLAIPDPGNPDDGGWYEPLDYDQTWHGVVSLRVALDNSLNIPALKVEQYGASVAGGNLRASVAAQAVKMGIRSLFTDNPHCCGWALTLGGLERGVRLVEETSAFGTFGTEGKTVPPVAIWKVWDRTTGKLLYDASKDNPDQPKQVLNPAYAYLMNNVLSDNSSRCTPQVCEFGLDSPLNLGRPVAAKTGTTNAFTDNWTVGYTPQIVTGVWVGNANNSPMVNSTGITGAAPIWHDFMLKAFQILNLPPVDFTEPSNVYFGSTCREPGPYISYGTGIADIYAGTVPFCTVGTSNTTLPIPQQSNPYQPPAVSQPAAPVVPQETPTPAPAAPGILQPTAQVQSAPQSPALQSTQAPAPAPVVPTQPPPAQAPVQQSTQPPVAPPAQAPAQPPAQQPAQPPAQQPAQPPPVTNPSPPGASSP